MMHMCCKCIKNAFAIESSIGAMGHRCAGRHTTGARAAGPMPDGQESRWFAIAGRRP